MKKFLMIAVVLVAVFAVTLPSFALEVKYGGLFNVRLQSNDNVTDGNDNVDDNMNFIEQRLRMYFTFVSSENLQVVTKWEADTRWGLDDGGRHGGGDVGADAVNLEMKNAYMDFAIPNTPVRIKTGVQGLQILDGGWILSDDFSSANAVITFAPIKVGVGYIGAVNRDVTDESENIDDVFLTVDYAQGPFKAQGVFIYQDARNRVTSIDPGLVANETFVASNFNSNPAEIDGISNELFDFGLSLEYKDPLWSAFVRFVKNFGGWDSGSGGNVFTIIPSGRGTNNVLYAINGDDDYSGWMLEAGGSVYCGPFTFNLGGFYTSGSDIKRVVFDPNTNTFVVQYEDFSDFFRYPAGPSHYWSEILGLGTLDAAIGGGGEDDRVRQEIGYASADHPSNLWMVTAGAAWQALEGTKLTLNYYYIGTSNEVLSGTNNRGRFTFDDAVGHELDFYVDQNIVDKLNLRLVAAYLFAEDAYTINNFDDDAYELGAVLQWAF